jgi:hypothetical protein
MVLIDNWLLKARLVLLFYGGCLLLNKARLIINFSVGSFLK